MTTMLQVCDLTHRYGKVQVVNGVSFEVEQGEVLTLLGPSGCGKTTILRLVAGLEEPLGGEIRLHGRAVAAPRDGVFVAAEHRNVGLVFQSYAVWPHMTVAQNVAYPLEVRRWPRARIQAKVDETLHLTGLQDYAGPPRDRAQRRPAAARLAGAGARLRAGHPAARRAAEQPRRAAAPGDAPASEGAAERGWAPPSCTSPTIRSRRWRCRTAWPSSTRAASSSLARPAEVYDAPTSYFVQSFVGQTLTLRRPGRAAERPHAHRPGGPRRPWCSTTPAARRKARGARGGASRGRTRRAAGRCGRSRCPGRDAGRADLLRDALRGRGARGRERRDAGHPEAAGSSAWPAGGPPLRSREGADMAYVSAFPTAEAQRPAGGACRRCTCSAGC